MINFLFLSSLLRATTCDMKRLMKEGFEVSHQSIHSTSFFEINMHVFREKLCVQFVPLTNSSMIIWLKLFLKQIFPYEIINIYLIEENRIVVGEIKEIIFPELDRLF